MARRREIAVRLAIGASRSRLVRQLLTESLALAALGGVAGLAMTSWARGGLKALLPTVPYPVFFDFEMDLGVLLFATLVTTAAALVFGLVPALQASRTDFALSLKDEIGVGAFGRARLQGALVVAQLTLSLITLVAAGLFVRSVGPSVRSTPACRAWTASCLVNTDLRLSGLRSGAARAARARCWSGRRCLSRGGLGGPGGARPGGLQHRQARVEGGPLRRTDGRGQLQRRERRLFPDHRHPAAGGPGAGRRGRGAAPVVVVNQAFVGASLAGRSAIGARLSQGGGDNCRSSAWWRPPRSRPRRSAAARVPPYSARFAPPAFALHVRTAGQPLALVSAVRAAFAEVSAELPFLDPRQMAGSSPSPTTPRPWAPQC
jgi:hypothetical protein